MRGAHHGHESCGMNDPGAGLSLRIGKLSFDRPVFLAPMAGITNLPFRTVARRCGCPLAFTEMVSVNGLVRRSGRTCRYLDSAPHDHPLGVQIFGDDPELMAEGARIVAERGADLIDINMGCPVKKVIRGGAGAALLRDPEKAGRIVRSVRRVTSLPLTVKIRAGWRRSEINAPLVSLILQEEGADAVIVHPRTADQGFGGTADWSVIHSVKEAVTIPVIGNGDLRCAGDVRRMLAATACDGVMIGRAALGNPWIFRTIMAEWPAGRGQSAEGESPAVWSGSAMEEGEENVGGWENTAGCEERTSSPDRREVSLEERNCIVREHLELETGYAGEQAGVRNFRKHLLWYTKGLRHSAALRQQLGSLGQGGEMLAVLQAYFENMNKMNNGLDFS